MLLAAFMAWEARTDHPMLPLHLFRSRAFTAANTVSLLMYFGMFGSIFLLSQFFQLVQGYNPFEAGLRVLPWTAMPAVVAPIAGAMTGRIGARPILVAGLALMAVGLAWLAAIITPTVPYAAIVPAFVVSGIGMGLFFAPIANVVLSAVRPQEEGKASGAEQCPARDRRRVRRGGPGGRLQRQRLVRDRSVVRGRPRAGRVGGRGRGGHLGRRGPRHPESWLGPHGRLRDRPGRRVSNTRCRGLILVPASRARRTIATGVDNGRAWRVTVQSYRTAATRLRHPVNVALTANAPWGVRVANATTGFMGSWKFIILQTIVVGVWVVGNIYLVFHFDPYPFIFLNLAFSTQAAYAAPLILLASNQSAVRDRATLEHAAAEAEDGDKKDDDLRARLERIEALLQQVAAKADAGSRRGEPFASLRRSSGS